MAKWPRRREVRKLEIARLRAEGERAFLDGKHIQTCPYKFLDAGHWRQGYREMEIRRQAIALISSLDRS